VNVALSQGGFLLGDWFISFALLFGAVNLGFSIGLFLTRRFWILTIVAMALQLIFWVVMIRHNHRFEASAIWPGLLIAITLWRQRRSRALYEPPADPPARGGPYR
jgi:hypothetical protein